MRRHDLDWARNVVVAALVVFHSARVFDTFDPFYVKSATTLPVADVVILAFAGWSMPLLFAVAGAATWFALGRRTAGEFRRERLARLLVPLVFGIAVVVPPQSYVAARRHGESAGYLEYWFGSYFTTWDDLTGYTGGFTTAHLWFLLVLAVIALALSPVLVRLRHAAPDGRAARVLARLRTGPGYLLVGLAATVLLAAVPDIVGMGIAGYAGYFLLGFVVLPDAGFSRWARRWRWVLLPAGAVLQAGAWAGDLGWEPGAFTPAAVLVEVAQQGATLLIVAGVLGVAASPRLPVRALPWLNRVCMPYYVVHQTVIVVLADLLLRPGWPAGVTWVVLMLCAAVVSAALAWGLTRLGPVAVLFGVKRPVAAPAAEPVRDVAA